MDAKITLMNYRCFSNENPARFSLDSGFTALIGLNNAGKSTLLRFFFEFRDLFSQVSRITGPISDVQSFAIPESVKDRIEVYNNLNAEGIRIEFELSLPVHRIGTGTEDIRLLIYCPRNSSSSTRIQYSMHVSHLQNGKYLEVEGAKISQERVITAPGFEVNGQKLFSLFQALTNSIYIGPFRNAILVEGKKSYYDIQIGNDFVERWNDYKSGPNKENNRIAAKLESDIARIFDLQRITILANNTKNNLQIQINDGQYGLDEVGAGLSQIIIVLCNTLISKPNFVFIDEPELNLHPSLQLDFLSTLGAYASEGIVFATHSIGLARSAATRIYSLILNGNGESVMRDYEETPGLSELLGELSFSGYRELGFDELLLVEGRTEVKTFFQLLQLYGIDRKVLILPLGGSSLINDKSEHEMLELTRISENISAIIDSERAGKSNPIPKDRRKFRELCERIGIECHILERRSIENYFTDAAVKAAMGEKFSALKEFDLFSDASMSWGKINNWKIAMKMTRSELEVTDLGEFLLKISRKITT